MRKSCRRRQLIHCALKLLEASKTCVIISLQKRYIHTQITLKHLKPELRDCFKLSYDRCEPGFNCVLR